MNEKKRKKNVEKILKFCFDHKWIISGLTMLSVVGIELYRKDKKISVLKEELYVTKGINKNLEHNVKGLRKEVSDLSYHLGKLSKGRNTL